MVDFTNTRMFLSGRGKMIDADPEALRDMLYTEIKVKNSKKNKLSSVKDSPVRNKNIRDDNELLIRNKEQLDIYLKSFGIETYEPINML